MLRKSWSEDAASASLHLADTQSARKDQLWPFVIYKTVPIFISLFGKVKGQLVCMANCKSTQLNFFKNSIISISIEKTRKIGLISETAHD